MRRRGNDARPARPTGSQARRRRQAWPIRVPAAGTRRCSNATNTATAISMHASHSDGSDARVCRRPTPDANPSSRQRTGRNQGRVCSRGSAACAFAVVIRAMSSTGMHRSSARAAPMRGNCSGTVALRVQPDRGNVRRIGFQHQRRQRHGGGQPAYLQRAREGHRAAEAELETQAMNVLRLLEAAVERMGDAARRADPAQVLEDDVLRTAHVQQHRQAEVARDASTAPGRNVPAWRACPASQRLGRKKSSPISPIATKAGSSIAVATVVAQQRPGRRRMRRGTQIGWMPSA